MCDRKHFFSAQTSEKIKMKNKMKSKDKMKSLSYLISCIKKANSQISKKLTMVKILNSLKI